VKKHPLEAEKFKVKAKGPLKIVKVKSPGKGHSLDPWVYFFVFVLINGVLAYGSWGIQTRLWMGLIGLLFPLLLAFSQIPHAGSKKTGLYHRELLVSIPSWLWFLSFAAAVLIRVLQITLWSHWPCVDDSVTAYYTLELYQKWNWHFFFGSSQFPPLFYWVMSFFYRVVEPSFLSLRLYPFLYSLAIALLAYPLARTFFPRSISFFIFLGSTTGFWILYTGQFCIPLLLAILLEMLTLAWLSRTASSQHPSRRDAFILGNLTGIGFFTAISWPLVAFAAALAFFFISRNGKKVSSPAYFIIPLLAWVLIFAWTCWQAQYGARLKNLWGFHPGAPLQDQLLNSTSYLTSIFWGGEKNYGPTWGGMVNPIFTSLFLLGSLEFRRVFQSKFLQWLLISFVLFMMPGLVTNTFDIFRIILIFPLLLIITGFGFQALLSTLAGSQRIFFIFLLFAVSSALDIRHLKVQRPVSSAESVEFSKAFQILDKTRLQSGPGYVFLDLRPNIWDKSLTLATYPFNAASNHFIPPQLVSWAGFIVNENYKPFLGKRFPGARWEELGRDALWPGEKLMLVLVPLNGENRPLFEKWKRANDYFQTVTSEIMDREPYESRERIFEILLGARDLAQGDLFLGSCLREKIFSFLSPLDPTGFRESIEKSIPQGYPVPHLGLSEKGSNKNFS
jgi:hypothetical protein